MASNVSITRFLSSLASSSGDLGESSKYVGGLIGEKASKSRRVCGVDLRSGGVSMRKEERESKRGVDFTPESCDNSIDWMLLRKGQYEK